MNPIIEITIGRRFDNRDKGEDDDSELAWELHRNRARIAEEELKNENDWKIVNWGYTFDDKRTHEDVTISLELAQAATTIALGFGGAVLYRVLEDTVVDAVKKLIRKFAPRLSKKEITRAYIKLPDGTHIEWNVPGYDCEVSVSAHKELSLTMKQIKE